MKTVNLILALAVCGAAVVAGCKKDEPVDPTKQKIEQLTAEWNKLADEVRAAVEPALTQPQNIASTYWGTFGLNNVPRATNLLDSVGVHIKTIEGFRRGYGDPLPTNDETVTHLYNKCKAFLATDEQLQELRDRQNN